jgi:hypothetical protein
MASVSYIYTVNDDQSHYSLRLDKQTAPSSMALGWRGFCHNEIYGA